MWPALSRVLLYAVIIVTPTLISAFQRPSETDAFPHELATRFGLLGFTILAMQFVVSARIKWVERPFGLDEVFRFHKAMAVFVTLLLISHPLIMAWTDPDWALITKAHQPWIIQIGRTAIVLLIILLIISLFRIVLRFEFQKWRLTHNIVGGIVLSLAFIHAFVQSGDLELNTVRAMIAALIAGGVAAYMYHMLVIPGISRRYAYTVASVKQETHNVWTLELRPPEGMRIPEYMPGQFHFITLFRQCGPPVEEHPFTISSSPAARGYLASTIKESGDYTSTIGSTKPGDRAALQGPFGRFSYKVRQDEHDLVFIAGGIGITPLMSMLRFLRDTGSDVNVLLLYLNRTEKDIIFKDEIEDMESGSKPRFKVNHILSKPDEDWNGETGFADRDKIERLVGSDVRAKSYYICGPAMMMGQVIRILLEIGVSESRIYYERFAL